MKTFLAVGLALTAILIFSGCVQQTSIGAGKPTAEFASEKCVQLCEAELQKGTDLSAGPCLDYEVVDSWACDVAHSPRAEIDNIGSNQCSTYGRINHFVEVDEDCKVIRVQ